jgi:hypothetical protein
MAPPRRKGTDLLDAKPAYKMLEPLGELGRYCARDPDAVAELNAGGSRAVDVITYEAAQRLRRFGFGAKRHLRDESQEAARYKEQDASHRVSSTRPARGLLTAAPHGTGRWPSG